MPYEVILTKTAEKSYDKLSAKLRQGVDRCLMWLEISPKYGPNIKGMTGLPGYYRFQLGGVEDYLPGE